MSISIRCKNSACRKPLRVKDDLVGKRVKCPACGNVLTIPNPASATDLPVAASKTLDPESRPSSCTIPASPRPGSAGPTSRHVLYSLITLATVFGVAGLLGLISMWLIPPELTNNSAKWLISVVCFLISALVGGYAIRYYRNMSDQAPSKFHQFVCIASYFIAVILGFPLFINPFGTSERLPWRDAEHKDTVEGYELYLEKWPTGPHAQEAQDRVADLIAHEALAKKYRELPEEQIFVDDEMWAEKGPGNWKRKPAPRFKGPFYVCNLSRNKPARKSRPDTANTLVLVKETITPKGHYTREGTSEYIPAAHVTYKICLIDKVNPAKKYIASASFGPAGSLPNRLRQKGIITTDFVSEYIPFESTNDKSDLLETVIDLLLKHIAQ